MRIASAFAALALLGVGCAQAQGWAPQKNVELIVPVAPGGTIDKLARAIERTFVAGKLVRRASRSSTGRAAATRSPMPTPPSTPAIHIIC